MAHFGARAGGEDEGDDAEDEGEAGHEDGAEAEVGGFDGGFGGGHLGVVFLLLLGELDNEHGVFHAHASEDDEADLGKDVVVHVAEPDGGDAAEEAHGDDEDDGGGECETLVFGRVGEADEQDAEEEDEEGWSCRRLCSWNAISVHS